MKNNDSLCFSIGLKTERTCGLIYLNLQKVVELLTCGRKGLRSAELKVPQLILCSERNKTERKLQRDQKRRGNIGVFLLTSKSWSLWARSISSSSLLCLQFLICWAHEKEKKKGPLCKGELVFDSCTGVKKKKKKGIFLNSTGNIPLVFTADQNHTVINLQRTHNVAH